MRTAESKFKIFPSANMVGEGLESSTQEVADGTLPVSILQNKNVCHRNHRVCMCVCVPRSCVRMRGNSSSITT